MSNKAIIEVGLDDESKKLLNAAIKAAAALAGAAADGKGKTAAAKGKGGPKAAAADEDDFMDSVEDADEEDADEEDADEEDADEEDADEDSGPTVDDVGLALQAYAKAPGGSKALAVKLLKAKGGTEKLSALKPAKFAAVITAVKAETAKLVKAAKAKK